MKTVHLDDYSVIKGEVMDGYKFVHSANHDDSLHGAVFIEGSMFKNCDFSELTSLTFIGNILDDCKMPPAETLFTLDLSD